MLDDMLNLIQILDVIQIHAMKIHTVIFKKTQVKIQMPKTIAVK